MTFSLQLARHRRSHAPRPGGSRRGFTLVELLTVLMVMGTVGRITLPNVHNLVLNARAQEVANRVALVHLAAVDYMQDHGDWPDDVYAGQIPPGLDAYLPEGFAFEGEGYRLDWENWMVPDGLPDDPGLGELDGGG